MVGYEWLIVDRVLVRDSLVTHARSDTVVIHRLQHSCVVESSKARSDHRGVAPQVQLVCCKELGYKRNVLRQL